MKGAISGRPFFLVVYRRSFEVPVNLCQITRRHIPEANTDHSHLRKNLRCHHFTFLIGQRGAVDQSTEVREYS
jgi:hypothetical protein